MKCKNHPNKEVVASCVECGNFFCSDCLTISDRKHYCPDCVKTLLENDAPVSKQLIIQQQQQLGNEAQISFPVQQTNWEPIISWGLSICFFLFALSYLARGQLAGIWSTLLGFLWLIPFNDWLKKEKNIEITLAMKIGASIFLLFLMGLSTPATTK
ncbi:hypothetical protein AUJ65_03985 [Candidatus Micrarchaeota archaeon CG1_02_51_15]|nr:MAG: hypothetical protein AUJ65_03985 [Candidatus Micrarchaeota archaeon CG1_02_51_15]